MRRGHVFETELGRVMSWLNEAGFHAHKNHPRRSVDGTFLEGEPFDYEVFSHGRLFCFDAKECHEPRWNLSTAKLSQIKHLMNCKKHGAEAFFLVLFAPRDVRKFDVEAVRLALAQGRKSLTAEEGGRWDWEELTRSRQK